MSFGERCYGYVGCGHSINWASPCTCDEESAREDDTPAFIVTKVQPPSEVERLKAQIEGMALYVAHDAGCDANDLDFLDKTPCTCGLRLFYSPKGLVDTPPPPAGADDGIA